ncbi:MAG: hypothetical protein KAT47_06425, partial [Candidatus Aegiribacteria sp.]|nr:hypothetical protein [Candidatus Aegiribacteria sp.]
ITGILGILIMIISFGGSVDGATIIDHTCADLGLIPASWIEAVQDNIPSHYAHTSHGGQLTYGIQFIKTADPFYDYAIGNMYLPTVSDAWCIFNGQESGTYIGPELYWQTESGMNLTRDVLDNNSTILTSMWCWCCQCDSYSEANVQAYLDSMTVLESEYPGVTFIYFTGNAQGTGSSGYNRWQRNEQIRDYCVSNNKILFDFADLDCWWYNPGTSSWEQETYSYGSDDIPAEHPEFYGNEYGHTTAESCIQKGEALWWMMAVIAGWQGTGIEEAETDPEYELKITSVNPASGNIMLSYSIPETCTVRMRVYACDGRLVSSPIDGEVASGSHEIILEDLCNGIYHCVIVAGEFRDTVNVVVLN